MSKYGTTHLSPSEIDRLRFKAFATNDQEDMAAYYRAASLYFQQRDVRAMNRADRIEELEAQLASAEDIIHIVASDKWGERIGEAVDLSCEYLAELKGQDDE